METGPDPSAAQTAAEFVAAMRQLRRWADLSYRQLERRAGDAGVTLPRATISGALAREDLPREELLAAFVGACGADADTIEAWLSARRRLAMNIDAPDPSPAGPVEQPDPAATAETDARDDSDDAVEPSDPFAGFGSGADSGSGSGSGAPPPRDDGHDDASDPDPRRRRHYIPMAITTACTVTGILLLALWADSRSNGALPGDGTSTSPSATDSASPTPSVLASASPRPSTSAPGDELTPVPPKSQPPDEAPAPRPTRTKAPAPTAPGAPKSGRVGIHPADASSLCLTEGTERKGGRPEIAVQGSCSPLPQVHLESLGGMIYRIQWHHPDPDKGIGCLGVDDSLTGPGVLLSPSECTSAASQRFRLEPSGSGHRLRPMHSGLCIGFQPPRTAGAEAVQTECSGGSDQVFRFTSA